MLSLIPLKWRAKFHYGSYLELRAQEVDSHLSKLEALLESVKALRERAAGRPAEQMVPFEALVEMAATQFVLYESLRMKISMAQTSLRLLGSKGKVHTSVFDMRDVDDAFERAMTDVRDVIAKSA